MPKAARPTRKAPRPVSRQRPAHKRPARGRETKAPRQPPRPKQGKQASKPGKQGRKQTGKQASKPGKQGPGQTGKQASIPKQASRQATRQARQSPRQTSPNQATKQAAKTVASSAKPTGPSATKAAGATSAAKSAGSSASGRGKPSAAPGSRPEANPANGKPGGPNGKGPEKPSPKQAKGIASKDEDANLSVSGQIYRNGKLVEGVLHIDTETGRIVRIAKSTIVGRHLDFGSKAILPGGIDLHVHFREPGHTHKEDLTSGSVSAAFGGVTGFVDMPNTLPATTTLRAVKEKLALMATKCVVDYAAWAGGSWYVGDLPQMLRHAAGVKTYLGATTGDLLLDDAERFQQILAATGQSGRPAVLHAESQRILTQMRRQEGTLSDHDTFRPPLAEVEAIYDAMKAMASAKKPPRVHVAHAASVEAVQAAGTAKFSVGVTPHHLLLDTSQNLTHAYGKVNPPLRAPPARKALFDLFAAGRIPILESDHAPHTTVEKEDNFHSAPSGMPGVETMVPLLLAQVKAGKVALGTVVDAVTVNPATLLGIQDRGALDAGLRADFAVYDLKAATKVEGKRLHSRCGWSPFEGHSAIFPSDTYLAGRPVVQDGDLVAEPGSASSMLPQPKE